MLCVAGVRAMRGLRNLSSRPPLREPGVVGLPMADATSRQVRFRLDRPAVRPPRSRAAPFSDTAPLPLPATQTLADLYGQTLAVVSDLPASAAYRVNVETLTRHRLAVVEGSEDNAAVEAKLGIGQIEEVIEQAKDELDLIPHMAKWQPWKVPDGRAPVKIELID
jgi:ETC complex I subunit conserved region